MTAYVPKGELREGDRVALELRTVRGVLLTVIQVSTVERVEPSKHHTSEEMDEVSF